MPLTTLSDLERRLRKLEMLYDQDRHKISPPDRNVNTSHPLDVQTTAKAADSELLDGINSTGFVQTSGNQTIGGVKTFSSLPTLPAGIPTANQPVRKGYADLAYLSILATAQNSDKLDGLDSTAFGRPVFLANPLTSNSFHNNLFSTTAKTKISLNALYGVPAGAKAVMVKIRASDSASSSNQGLYAGVGANNADSNLSVIARPAGLPSDYYSEVSGTCACDANGDIYFQCLASGTNTLKIRIQIYGYWL